MALLAASRGLWMDMGFRELTRYAAARIRARLGGEGGSLSLVPKAREGQLAVTGEVGAVSVLPR